MNQSEQQLLQELQAQVADLQSKSFDKVEIKTIDISKPIIVPYTHKEFPKMVYNHAKRQTKVVQNEEEFRALGAPWTEKAFLPENQLTEKERLSLQPKAELLRMAKEEYDLDVIPAMKKEEIVEKILKCSQN